MEQSLYFKANQGKLVHNKAHQQYHEDVNTDSRDTVIMHTQVTESR